MAEDTRRRGRTGRGSGATVAPGRASDGGSDTDKNPSLLAGAEAGGGGARFPGNSGGGSLAPVLKKTASVSKFARVSACMAVNMRPFVRLLCCNTFCVTLHMG